MSLDIRSQMAVNLCANLDVPPGEAFNELAKICKAWGYGIEESMPLCHALKEKLGINTFGAAQAIRATLDGQELKLRRMN